MSDITLQQFHENYTVTIVRFELYPTEEPTSWCVGYSVVNNNNKYSMYVDTNVALDSSKTNEDVLNESWDKVKENVHAWVQTVHCKSSLLNAQFKPKCLCDKAEELVLQTTVEWA